MREISSLQRRILKTLLMNGRESFTNIAKTCGVTKSTIWKNYREMLRSGVITGATIQMNYRSFEYKIVTELLVTIHPDQSHNVLKCIEKMEGIYCAVSTATNSVLSVIAVLRDFSELNNLKDAIRTLPSVQDIRTSVWTNIRTMRENLSLLSESESVTRSETGKWQPMKDRTSDCQIDVLDLEIVEKLSEDGRKPFRAIAKEIGTSTFTVARRYARLARSHTIRTIIQIDPKKIGYHSEAIFYMTVTSQTSHSEIVEAFSLIPDVVVILQTTGRYDFQVGVLVRDIEHLLSVQREISKIRCITSLNVEVYALDFAWPNPREYISTF